MDATDLKDLPDDVATLKRLLAEQRLAAAERDAVVAEQHATIHELQRENMGLSHRLDLAMRRLYGRSSEKIDPTQLLLFGQAMQQAAQTMEAMAQAQAKGASSPAATPGKGHGRRPLPADLPRHRIEHPIAPEALTCPCCAQPRVRIGQDVSEQLDYTPASLFVIQHPRGAWEVRLPQMRGRRRGHGGAKRRGPGDRQRPARSGAPGVVAHVAVSKYADHAPLYRLEGMLARHGVQIARSTMCGWMKAAADLLTPLVKLMGSHIRGRGSKVIHTDDTPVPVLCPGRGKTKTGRMWVYIGDLWGSGGPGGPGGSGGSGASGGPGGRMLSLTTRPRAAVMVRRPGWETIKVTCTPTPSGATTASMPLAG